MILFPGKTVFLVRLLIRRLSLGLPTALQFAPDCAHLFCEKGVYEFGRLDNPELYNKLRRGTDARIWALIDSNDDLVQPAALFTNRSPFFVVEAAPPLDDHFEWMKKAHTMRFYMKPWTFPEVCQAYVDFSSLYRHNFMITPLQPYTRHPWGYHRRTRPLEPI